jgi:hypothetical protein
MDGMDIAQARRAAEELLSTAPPGVDDAVLTAQTDDHEWCFVIPWTTRRAMESGSFADAPPPGIGPIGVDKQTGEAFYLSSVPLPIALDVARSRRR